MSNRALRARSLKWLDWPGDPASRAQLTQRERRSRAARWMRGAAAVLALAVAAPVFAGSELFRLTDPRGDDNGDGTLRYPINYYGVAPGDLDLLSLVARRVSGGTEFEATLAAPVRSPEGRTIDIGGGQMKTVARFGFYDLNLDIYIDMDRRPDSGGVRTLPGRKATVEPASGWERAIMLTPRPHEAASSLRRSMLRSLRRELELAGEGEAADMEKLGAMIPADLERHVFFPSRIRVSGRSIRFFVPDDFLGGPASAQWSYVVFTSGADVDQRFTLPDALGGSAEDGLFILPAAPGGAADRFGGRRDDDRGQPPIVDLIVPPGRDQAAILSSYDISGKRWVELPGVVPEPAKP